MDTSPGPSRQRPDADQIRLKALLDVLATGVLFVDADRRVIYCNSTYRVLWNLPVDTDLRGRRDTEVTAMTAGLREDDGDYRRHLREVVAGEGVSDPYDVVLRDGRILCETSKRVVGPDGAEIGRVWLFEDVTAQRQAERCLVELAERDPLTGLYNRRRFQSELDRLIADATRRGSLVGLLMFDLDKFKPINDRYGHKAGDEVLVRMSKAVGAIVRRNEQFFRIGGDEFALIVPEAQEIELAGLAKRVLATIDAVGYEFGGELQHVSASLGIAIYPQHALNAPDLVQCADAAMYRVKAGGRHGWGFCEA